MYFNISININSIFFHIFVLVDSITCFKILNPMTTFFLFTTALFLTQILLHSSPVLLFPRPYICESSLLCLFGFLAKLLSESLIWNCDANQIKIIIIASTVMQSSRSFQSTLFPAVFSMPLPYQRTSDFMLSGFYKGSTQNPESKEHCQCI